MLNLLIVSTLNIGRLVAPLISVFHFENGMISSIRYYWDQASILRQIGILPNSLFCKPNKCETVLPIVGIKIADPIMDSVSRQAPFEESPVQEETVGTVEAIRKGTEMSSILSGEAEAQVVKPSTRVHNKTASDIFSLQSVPAPEVRASRPQTAHDDAVPAAGARSGSVNNNSRRRDPNMSSAEVAMMASAAEPAAGMRLDEYAHEVHGKKMSVHSGNSSQFSLANDTPGKNVRPHSSRKMVDGRDTNESHFNIGGVSVADDSVKTNRNPHSNDSHFSLAGSDTDVYLKNNRPVNPHSNDSHFSLDGSDENVEPRTGRRQATGMKSALSLGESFDDVEPVINAKRDFNQRTEQVQQRPSSRVYAFNLGISPSWWKEQLCYWWILIVLSFNNKIWFPFF